MSGGVEGKTGNDANGDNNKEKKTIHKKIKESGGGDRRGGNKWANSGYLKRKGMESDASDSSAKRTKASSGDNSNETVIPTCFRCREKGHKLYDCPKSKKETKGGGSKKIKGSKPERGTCFNCGGQHSLYSCPKPKVGGGAQFATCFVCNEKGHLSKDCPTKAQSGSVYPNGGACHTCGEVTHLVKDCPKKDACRVCGEEGHQERFCTNKDSENAIAIAEKKRKAFGLAAKQVKSNMHIKF